jgi:hemerythrin-like domain-containing protein
MQSILEYMSADHGRCDGYFAVAEQSVADRNWDQAATQFDGFSTAMEIHFRKEERILFPQFERATGHGGGPTAAMRTEHEQLRAMLKSMQTALQERDMDGFLGASETLLILMQQHNMKEEQILYPMLDNMLSEVSDQLIVAMENVTT